MNTPIGASARGVRPRAADLVAAVLLGAAFALVYARTFAWMGERFLAPASYFSHGLLVPFLSGFLAWRVRGSLRWGTGRAPLAGGALLGAAAALHLAAAALRVHFVSGLSILPALTGLVLLLGGRTAARRLLFPVLFLGFMVPLPMWAVANLSLALKLHTAEIALRLANAAGIVAIREGATIHFPGAVGSLTVGDVCSGLRYSVALLAFGALLAYRARLGRIGKTALFLASVPAAVLANVARVLLLLLLATLLGAERASGSVHDLSGVLVFVVAFLLLMGAEKLGRRLSRRRS